MNSVYLKLVKLLTEKKPVTLTVPELNIRLSDFSYADLAIALKDFVDESTLKSMDFIPYHIDVEKVKNALNIIRYKKKNKMKTIVLTGSKKREVFSEIKKKYENEIVETKLIRTAITDSHVLFTINISKLDQDFFPALLSTGITVKVIEDDYISCLSDAIKETRVCIEMQGFENYVNSMGYFIDEYIMALIIDGLEQINSKNAQIVFDHMDSKFVLSLSAIYLSKSGIQEQEIGNEIKILGEILEEIPFDRINDYSYVFVKEFMYGKKI